jgi:EmrB/QacA subfamily drug resistance transporter
LSNRVLEDERPGHTVSRAEFLNLFASVFLPMFMAAVDQTLLATATPAIAASLGGLRDTSWIAVGYLLASATIVPVYGRMGDRKGRRDVLLVALGVFTLGSAACGFAQSLPQLVAARVLQGLGGGGLMTLCQALIGELVPPRERARFQGYFALVFTAASVAGPVVGGLVVSHASWRWLFLANLPLAAFAAWRLCRLPKGEKHPPPTKALGGDASARGADLAGHVLFAVGALCTLFWLTSGGHRFPWGSPQSLALLATGAVALGLLWRHERRHEAPFLPVELLRERTVLISVMVVAMFASCLFAVVFFLPIYLQLGHQMSAQGSGLLLLPVTAGMVVASTTSSRILARTGRPHWIPVIGLSLSSAALFALALAPADETLIGCFAFFAGLGFGCVMPTTQVTMQTVAGRERLGVVTALMALARSTGGATGPALFGAVAFAMMPAVAQGRPMTSPFHTGFLVFAFVAAAAAFTASRMPVLTLWRK